MRNGSRLCPQEGRVSQTGGVGWDEIFNPEGLESSPSSGSNGGGVVAKLGIVQLAIVHIKSSRARPLEQSWWLQAASPTARSRDGN